MYISGWQHMSSATADIISPYLVSWYWHASFPFSLVFSTPPPGLHNETGKTSSASGAAVLTWAVSQPARVVCPALKATCVTTASHLAPERCKLPFLFYYFPPFIDVQAWRIFFFNYPGLEGAFLLPFLKKTTSLKTTITQKPQTKTKK